MTDEAQTTPPAAEQQQLSNWTCEHSESEHDAEAKQTMIAYVLRHRDTGHEFFVSIAGPSEAQVARYIEAFMGAAHATSIAAGGTGIPGALTAVGRDH
jgi:hypothetical protein